MNCHTKPSRPVPGVWQPRRLSIPVTIRGECSGNENGLIIPTPWRLSRAFLAGSQNQSRFGLCSFVVGVGKPGAERPISRDLRRRTLWQKSYCSICALEDSRDFRTAFKGVTEDLNLGCSDQLMSSYELRLLGGLAIEVESEQSVCALQVRARITPYVRRRSNFFCLSLPRTHRRTAKTGSFLTAWVG